MKVYIDEANPGRADGSERYPFSRLKDAIAKLTNSPDKYNQVYMRSGWYPHPVTLKRVCDGRVDVFCNEAVIDSTAGGIIVSVLGGEWRFYDGYFGDYSAPTRSQNALYVKGNGTSVHLYNTEIRTGSLSSTVWADMGAMVMLGEDTLINANMAGGDLRGMTYTHAGISATNRGIVKYGGRRSSNHGKGQLSMGSGNLSASNDGEINLGWPDCYITSHAHQANCYAVNGHGRLNLRGSNVTIKASNPKNAAIGPEHHGDILHENAMTTVDCSTHDQTIAFQKCSTMLGGKSGRDPGNIVIRGPHAANIWASTGSMAELHLAFTDGGSVGYIRASTGARMYVKGPVNLETARISASQGGEVWVNGARVA